MNQKVVNALLVIALVSAIGCSNSSASNESSLGTSTSMQASATTLNIGQTVTFTATVTAPTGIPTGTVTFLDGTTILAASQPLTAGVSTFTTGSLAVGGHNITAAYSGAASLGTSTSSPVNVTVNSANGISNLALNRPSGSSSFCNGCNGNTFNAQRAVDGNVATGWVAANGSFPQWIVVDLGALSALSSVNITFVASDTWRYKIEGSNDNAFSDLMWTTLADHTSLGISGQTNSDNVTGTFRYLRVYVTNTGNNWAAINEFQVFGATFSQPRNVVSPPVPLNTGSYLIGAQACNLWDNSGFWNGIAQMPLSRPLLGYYNEAYDVSTDWNIKMMVDHGISFVMPCWYRMPSNDGQSPVIASFDQFINSIANSAQYRSSLKWAVDWINGQGGTADGVSDFVNNLFPFWLNNYINKGNYLTIGGKPVVVIYDAGVFATQMGSVANATSAISQARALAVKAGYPGIVFMTAWNGSPTNDNSQAYSEGFDYVFAYNNFAFTGVLTTNTPTGQQVISAEQTYWSRQQADSKVAPVLTASVGWNGFPWGEGQLYAELMPLDYKALLTDAQTAMSNGQDSIQKSVLLLDNWNEFGEGHFIEPAQQYGYGYLDAVASVFSPGSSPADPIPTLTQVPQVINPIYNITSVGDGTNLAFASGNLQESNGDAAIQTAVSPASTLQQWVLDPGPIGSFYIRNVSNNLDLSAAGGYSVSQSAIPLQSNVNVTSTLQQWQPLLQPTAAEPFEAYLLLTWNSQALTVAGTGNAALTYPYTDTSLQLWNFTLFSY